MIKSISTILIALMFFTFSCDDKDTQKVDLKERITWIRKYIKESELLKDSSANLIQKASYHYQRETLAGVVEPEDLYTKSEKELLIDFIKNTSKRLKIKNLNEFLAIIKTIDFGSEGEITKVDHLWIKKNEGWILFEHKSESLPFPGQKISIEELKYKKGKFILLHGGCCDTESLAILQISNSQSLVPLYTGTLYGNRYKFVRKNGKLQIFERDIENNLNEISLEER
ncbi:hypothetical protein [Leptospira meyeri]|uniref:hypothetical protein n=1 Tax=Leptospira meyeri TaxID=29508 RepID=UPI0002BFDD7A|nr:hypothetical protein [Leptospira meyeri]EMJ88578.1 putative lipoprotein [Leptospira meyeri serovar Semaranga str. Veldrot Semarang 173]